MELTQNMVQKRRFELSPLNQKGAFSRLDESDDRSFYARDRFVNHLDEAALNTVSELIGQLVVEESPAILDLMAGWESHIPQHIKPSKVVGLGLNPNELAQNGALTEVVLHDLNHDPQLPFPDDTFDVVLNTVSVDYLVKPLEVFQEVARVLKPGGLFLVIFSNRMFPQKAVKIWQESDEEERVMLVQEFFEHSGSFEAPHIFVSKGRPRPKTDKYAHTGLPSDPIYAVYADRIGGKVSKKRPDPVVDYVGNLEQKGIEDRKRAVRENLCCPYCGERLKKWAVPDNPFGQTWDNDYMYICFNDECSYYVRGWDHMYKEGNRSTSYRLMYHPEKDRCMPIPVPSPRALKDGIVDGA
ncbi:MAG: methyltransferase domain-containing protein [Desulfobacteraceae bacterium]